MRWRRPVLVLAIVAALGAPSSVLGASPNELRAPYVSPTAGYTSTTFVMSVQYRSSAGNPAQSVTAAVGGETLQLILVDGSAVNGTWAGGSLLPAGTWTVTFHATVAQGKQPTLRYGTVTVSGSIFATPRPSTSSPPTGSVDDPGGGAGSSAQPAPQATASPQPSPPPAPASQSSAPRASTSAAPAPGSGTSGGAATGTGGSGTGKESGGGTSPGVHSRPASPRAGGKASAGRTDGSAASPVASAGHGGNGNPIDGEPDGLGLLWLVLLIGISGVAAVALTGTAWVLLAARRERAQEVAAVEPDLAARAIPAVEQRALRRARLRSTNDPILAGLGLDDEPSAGPAPATRPKRAATRRTRSPRDGDRA